MSSPRRPARFPFFRRRATRRCCRISHSPTPWSNSWSPSLCLSLSSLLVLNRRPRRSLSLSDKLNFRALLWLLSSVQLFRKFAFQSEAGVQQPALLGDDVVRPAHTSVDRSSRDADLGSARHVLSVDVLFVDSRVMREASEIETAGEPGATKTHSSGAVLGSGRRGGRGRRF